MYKATFDPAQNLDLYFRKGRNGSKELRFFNAAEEPFILTDEFEIISDFPFEHEVEDHKIILTVDQDDTKTVRNSYFWELKNLTTGRTWLCGAARFTIENSAAITDTENITIVLEGEPINITISEAGVGEHYKGQFDASVNEFPGDENTLGGDFWIFSVGGTLDGEPWPAKTKAFAIISNPGQDPDNWRLS